MSIVVHEPEGFVELLRICNTNVDGRKRVLYALTDIKGVGRRFACLAAKKADVDLRKRLGECTQEEINRLADVINDPEKYKIPKYFMNRQFDRKTGKFFHAVSNTLDQCLREDLERLKKIRAHRGLRHMWGLKVRGQKTKTTGRKGKTMGVSHTRQR